MERYIGLDAHASSCTLGIVGPSGKRLGSQVVETNAQALIEVLGPHVEELTVVEVGKSRARRPTSWTPLPWQRSFGPDHWRTTVYKNRGQFRRLGERAKSYDFLVGDTVRVKNRLKSVLRSIGVAYGAGGARLDRVGGVAHGRSVRPQETGSDEVIQVGISERGVEGGHTMGSDEPEANRLQGTASIRTVGRGREPKPPSLGQ